MDQRKPAGIISMLSFFSAPLFFPGIVAGVDDQVFLPVHIPDADDRSFFFTPGEFKMQGVAADIVSAALVL